MRETRDAPLCRKCAGRLLLCALFLSFLGSYISLTSIRINDPTIINAEIDYGLTSISSFDPSPAFSKPIGDNTSTLTVLISTYNQTDCLHRLVSQLQTCSEVVDNIRINWFQSSPIPPSIANNSNWEIPVTFDVLPNRISHRFLPRDFRTDAVFNMDVDMAYSCEALQLSMDTWLKQPNQTHTAIGFFPRKLPTDGKYYRFDESHFAPYNRNTVFITKGGVMHKSRFEDFFESTLTPMLNSVDEHITAEDMLMSYVFASNQVKIITLCVPRSYWCNIVCASDYKKGRYNTLQKRSGGQRGQLLSSFRDYFGNVLMDNEDNQMIWHDGTKYGDECNTEYNLCRQHDWMK